MKKLVFLLVVAVTVLNSNIFAQSDHCKINLSSYWAETPNWTVFNPVPTSVCVGQTASFNITLDGTYYWELESNHPNPAFSTAGTSNAINFTTPTFIGQGNYQFVLTIIGSGCNRDTTLSVAALGAPSNLTLSASPGDQVCAGTEVTFTAGATNALPGSSTYTWYVNGSLVTVADPTSNELTYTPSNGQSFSFEVSNGTCSATLPLLQAISMMVYGAPTPTIAFADLNNLNHFCDGQTAVINETSGITNIASWQFVVAGTPHTVINPTYSWTAAMAQNGQEAHVVVTDGNGCQGTSNILTIGVDALPDLSVAPIAYSTCNGADMHLKLSGFTGVGPYNLEIWNAGHTTQYSIVSSTPPILPASGTIDVNVDIPYTTPTVHVRIIDTGTGCRNW